MDFLPISKADMHKRGWDELDVIFISGDAYVDHPAFAASILGRFLEYKGFRVGIIAQPDWQGIEDFQRLGRPRLFFAVTAGNVDSLVNHYTADKKKRHDDIYSPGGQGGLRPNRATIVYCNRLREAFPGVNIVIGGIEASLRRLAHYDYWSDKVRRSLLLDSRADLLAYGMGEHTLWNIARRLRNGEKIENLTDMRGICYATSQPPADVLQLPSLEEVQASPEAFARADKMIHQQINPYCAQSLVQKHGDRWVVQTSPILPFSTEQLDEIYNIKFMRQAHPIYDSQGGVPALEPVQFSLLTHRGCFGGCSFCSIGLHQGKFIQNRSIDSLVKEAESFLKHPDFRGSIPDVGAPSANMYKMQGDKESICKQCRRASCLYPQVCPNLNADSEGSIKLWQRLRQIKGIKNIRVASGVRYDLILRDKTGKYLKNLCRYHVGGQLKVAPEHIAESVTNLMGKPSGKEYEKFVRLFNLTNKQLGKKQFLIPYFIAAHPGAGVKETIALAEFVRDNMQYYPEQVQNFTPTPMTISTCMWYTGINPHNGQRVYVPKQSRERRYQRVLLQYRNPDNYNMVREALEKAGRPDLIGFSSQALVRPKNRKMQGKKRKGKR